MNRDIFIEVCVRSHVQVPVFLGGAFSRLFQRVVIVLQLVEAPWATIPDWRGASLRESKVCLMF